MDDFDDLWIIFAVGFFGVLIVGGLVGMVNQADLNPSHVIENVLVKTPQFDDNVKKTGLVENANDEASFKTFRKNLVKAGLPYFNRDLNSASVVNVNGQLVVTYQDGRQLTYQVKSNQDIQKVSDQFVKTARAN